MDDKKLIISTKECIGCKSCELACSFVHTKNPEKPAVSRIKAYSYTDEVSVVVTCQQCDDAGCVRVCPVKALSMNEMTGVVEFDKKKCIECGMCAIACPFGNINIDAETKDIEKCDLCQGDPACAKFCPTDALEYALEPGLAPKVLERRTIEPGLNEIKYLPPRPWTINAKLLKYRRMLQVGLGVVFTNSYIPIIWTKELYSGPLRNVCIPGLNCHSCPFSILACPIGVLQSVMSIHQFPFYILGFVALIGMLVGRAACGWICPFGWIQDMMYKIRSKKFKIPGFLRHIRWFSLIVLTIYLPWLTGVHWFSKLCPYGALIGAIPWAVWNPINPVFEEPVIEPGSYGFWFVAKMVILAGFLIWFVLAKRPFCRTTCPMGLIFSWFNKISFLKLEVSKPQCSGCTKCNNICPTDLDPVTEIETSGCIKCLDCTACGQIEAKFSMRYGFVRDKLRKAVEKIRKPVLELKS